MELKLKVQTYGSSSNSLLIVPYGIETNLECLCNLILDLLIVPYGIETKELAHVAGTGHYLLIVPYGIETNR